MSERIMFIVILMIICVLGGFFANTWVTKKWPDGLLGRSVAAVTAPACVFILLVGSLFSLVALPFVAVLHRSRELAFVTSMKKCGRYKEWIEIERTPTEGTLIIEQAQKDGCRVWWTQDDVTSLTPHRIPEEKELDYLRLEEPIPFVQWCSDHYTSINSGRALLTNPPFSFPPGFLTVDFLRSKIPTSKVIATVKMAMQRKLVG